MEQELLKNGSVRIFVSAREMDAFGITFASLDIHTEATRTFLAAVLLAAGDCAAFDLSRVTVEALPTEDGCILLLSPSWTLARRVRRKNGTPLIYEFSSADALLGLAAAWRKRYAPPSYLGCALSASSLYTFAEGYRLILYPLSPLSLSARQLLCEWGQKAGYGEAAVAFTAEHGHAVCIGDALPRLCGAYNA